MTDQTPKTIPLEKSNPAKFWQIRAEKAEFDVEILKNLIVDLTREKYLAEADRDKQVKELSQKLWVAHEDECWCQYYNPPLGDIGPIGCRETWITLENDACPTCRKVSVQHPENRETDINRARRFRDNPQTPPVTYCCTNEGDEGGPEPCTWTGTDPSWSGTCASVDEHDVFPFCPECSSPADCLEDKPVENGG